MSQVSEKVISAGRFLWRNKAKAGAPLIALGTWLGTMGHEWDAWSKLLLAIGGLLLGGGAMPSDRAVKAKQEWEDSGGSERRG